MFVSILLSTMLVGQVAPDPVWRVFVRPILGTEIDVYLVTPGYCDGHECHPDTVIGGYDYDRQLYYPLDSTRNIWLASAPVPKNAPPIPLDWRRPAPKPLAPPDQPKTPPRIPIAPKRPTGVIASDPTPAGQAYTVNGVAFTAGEAAALLNDDSTLPFLTIVAEPDKWRGILDSLPAELKAASRLKCMPPTFWGARKFGVPGGSTGVFYQESSGKVLARQSPFVDPAGFLAQLKGKDEPLPKPPPESPEPPLAPPTSKSRWLYAAVALLCLFIARNP